MDWVDRIINIKKERVRDETDRSAMMLESKKKKMGIETTDLHSIYI